MLNECKVIGIMNLKGGCGKTTTAFNLADNLTRRDFNVLLVDTDSQANLTRNCGIEKSTKLENTVATSMYAVMSGEEMDPAKAGIISVKESLDIFPANSTMAQAKIMLSRAMAREQVLKKVLEPIKPAYDFIIIDTAPSLDIDVICAMTACDEIIVPSNAAMFSVDGTQRIIQVVDKVRANLNSELKLSGILLTKVDKRLVVVRDIITELRKGGWLMADIFETEIPPSVRVNESQVARATLNDYEPENPVAKAYEEFTDELLTKIGGYHDEEV